MERREEKRIGKRRKYFALLFLGCIGEKWKKIYLDHLGWGKKWIKRYFDHLVFFFFQIYPFLERKFVGLEKWFISTSSLIFSNQAEKFNFPVYLLFSPFVSIQIGQGSVLGCTWERLGAVCKGASRLLEGSVQVVMRGLMPIYRGQGSKKRERNRPASIEAKRWRFGS